MKRKRSSQFQKTQAKKFKAEKPTTAALTGLLDSIIDNNLSNVEKSLQQGAPANAKMPVAKMWAKMEETYLNNSHYSRNKEKSISCLTAAIELYMTEVSEEKKLSRLKVIELLSKDLPGKIILQRRCWSFDAKTLLPPLALAIFDNDLALTTTLLNGVKCLNSAKIDIYFAVFLAMMNLNLGNRKTIIPIIDFLLSKLPATVKTTPDDQRMLTMAAIVWGQISITLYEKHTTWQTPTPLVLTLIKLGADFDKIIKYYTWIAPPKIPIVSNTLISIKQKILAQIAGTDRKDEEKTLLSANSNALTAAKKPRKTEVIFLGPIIDSWTRSGYRKYE